MAKPVWLEGEKGDLWEKIQNQQKVLAKLQRKYETVKGDLLATKAERDRYRTLLRRALVYLPDNSSIARDVKAALRSEDPC